mmetsp:Transcript_36512/g.109721  ORF Transcript_36512/g.109721 Transcript_36512/m.109721 type:complete len:220 (+) Transcript_36512:219-878(+)
MLGGRGGEEARRRDARRRRDGTRMEEEIVVGPRPSPSIEPLRPLLSSPPPPPLPHPHPHPHRRHRRRRRLNRTATARPRTRLRPRAPRSLLRRRRRRRSSPTPPRTSPLRRRRFAVSRRRRLPPRRRRRAGTSWGPRKSCGGEIERSHDGKRYIYYKCDGDSWIFPSSLSLSVLLCARCPTSGRVSFAFPGDAANKPSRGRTERVAIKYIAIRCKCPTV